MKIEHDISLFYGRAIIEPGKDAGGYASWENCDMQNINTKWIHHTETLETNSIIGL